eukprot:TRINITY_DN5786_c0_g1_i1.p1 TRINITY_DN5786_c0_g1~~TRINITY_DN5786_c0_g1_i1.p1  ORF type:complete len:578 (-),score=68.11 TRINITY_DN5786_c0_g1_i1:52-1785(-)
MSNRATSVSNPTQYTHQYPGPVDRNSQSMNHSVSMDADQPKLVATSTTPFRRAADLGATPTRRGDFSSTPGRRTNADVLKPAQPFQFSKLTPYVMCIITVILAYYLYALKPGGIQEIPNPFPSGTPAPAPPPAASPVSPAYEKEFLRFKDSTANHIARLEQELRGVRETANLDKTMQKKIEALQAEVRSLASIVNDQRRQENNLDMQGKGFDDRLKNQAVVQDNLQKKLVDVEGRLLSLHRDMGNYVSKEALQQELTALKSNLPHIDENRLRYDIYSETDRVLQASFKQLHKDLESTNQPSANDILREIEPKILSFIEASVKTMPVASPGMPVQYDGLSTRQYNELKDMIAAQVSDIASLRYQLSHRPPDRIIERIPDRTTGNSGITEARVRAIVDAMLTVYEADKTNMTDYALASMGGRILIAQTSQRYRQSFGDQLRGTTSQHPSVVLTPDNSPGQCFAFAGQEGHVTIELPMDVHITAVTLDHIPAAIAPDISSAPHTFQVYGIGRKPDGQGEFEFLGQFNYDATGRAVQVFHVQPQLSQRAYRRVLVQIKSNHGNPDFTCLYRVRIHGDKANA